MAFTFMVTASPFQNSSGWPPGMQEAWLVAKRQAAKSARDADTKPIVTIISEMKMNLYGSRNRVIFFRDLAYLV
jgi:hypothetical protein